MFRGTSAILFVALIIQTAPAVELYGVTDVALYTVDPTTGVATEIATLSPDVPGLLGGLEWADGVLYGLAGTPGNRLWTVDPATGEVTEVGPLGGGGYVFEGGLAYDGKTMWGVNYGIFGGPKSLVSIDLRTGAATLIGRIGDGDVDFNGLAVYEGGLYGVERVTNSLWYIDTANPAASYQIGAGFGGAIDQYPKGGMAGEYAYADASHNFFRVDFDTGLATVLATTAVQFRALATIPEPPIPGDIDGDGDVDLADLATLLASYDTCTGDPAFNPAADLDHSGCIDLTDLATLLAHYGEGV